MAEMSEGCGGQISPFAGAFLGTEIFMQAKLGKARLL
jgi:hypothetical protein